MINLNNDVLNKDRRQLFPKINTLSNKFSLNNMNFLKQQNPFKFYRTFYIKHIQNSQKNKTQSKPIKSVTFLSLLSKTQNHFYSLPIKYDSTIENNVTKSNRNLELNKLETDSKIKKEKGVEPDFIYDNNEINYIDFLKNKTLRNLHKYLMGSKEFNNNFIKKKENKLKEKKRSKSSFNIYMENLENNLAKNKINNGKNGIFRNSINSNVKRSRKLQTIKSEYGLHDKLIIEEYKYSKQKYEAKKEGRKFSIELNNNINRKSCGYSRNRKNKNKFLTSNGSGYEIKVFWNNLRRPIIINSSNSVFIK
jgi:hypothetical protein